MTTIYGYYGGYTVEVMKICRDLFEIEKKYYFQTQST